MKTTLITVLGTIIFSNLVITPSYSQTCAEVFAGCKQAHDEVVVNGHQNSCFSCKNRCGNAEDTCLHSRNDSTFVSALGLYNECKRQCP